MDYIWLGCGENAVVTVVLKDGSRDVYVCDKYDFSSTFAGMEIHAVTPDKKLQIFINVSEIARIEVRPV